MEGWSGWFKTTFRGWDAEMCVQLHECSSSGNQAEFSVFLHTVAMNESCTADLVTNQAVLDPRVHCHTSRVPQVGIEPASPQTQAVALPT